MDALFESCIFACLNPASVISLKLKLRRSSRSRRCAIWSSERFQITHPVPIPIRMLILPERLKAAERIQRIHLSGR